MLRENWWQFVLWQHVPYISKFLFISVMHLSRNFLRIFKHYSIHRLKLGFLNYIIAPIWLIWFTTLNVAHLCKSVRDVVDLKCCYKWETKESDFCPFLRRCWTSEKIPPIIFCTNTTIFKTIIWCIIIGEKYFWAPILFSKIFFDQSLTYFYSIMYFCIKLTIEVDIDCFTIKTRIYMHIILKYESCYHIITKP